MAPTKVITYNLELRIERKQNVIIMIFIIFQPLVAQQIEACYKIMGIPQSETSEMTGNVSVSNRQKAWAQKRVFFLTPQVMSNDLSRGLFPADQVSNWVFFKSKKYSSN